MYAHFLSVSDFQKSTFDCCKWIFKPVMNNWSIVLFNLDTCVDLYLYISSHFSFLFQELYKCQSRKENFELKESSHILVYDQEKGKVICIKIYGANSQRLNCQSSFKMFMTSLLKNLSCFNQKYVNGSKTKSFQSIVITLVRGHICSFLQVRQVT